MATRIVLAMLAGLALASVSEAQIVPGPYTRGNVVLFAPDPGMVLSGTAMAPTPVVSADRRYVTLGMNVQASQVLRIENFPIMAYWPTGVVGNVRPAALALGADTLNMSSPVLIRNGQGGMSLNQVGLTRVASLD